MIDFFLFTFYDLNIFIVRKREYGSENNFLRISRRIHDKNYERRRDWKFNETHTSMEWQTPKRSYFNQYLLMSFWKCLFEITTIFWKICICYKFEVNDLWLSSTLKPKSEYFSPILESIETATSTDTSFWIHDHFRRKIHRKYEMFLS